MTAADLLSLSRVGAGCLLARAALTGRGRRPAWWALVLGCTLTDWLDGPLARRLGASPRGDLLDIEADSWLTLWSAVAAFRLGGLGGWVLLAPALRYPLAAGRPAPPLRPWQRAAGAAQMTSLCAALSPWGLLRQLGRTLAPPAAAAQLAALAWAETMGRASAKAGG